MTIGCGSISPIHRRSIAKRLAKIEDEVNERVLAAEPSAGRSLPIAEARKAGAMMLFGEKYPDIVRMVSMGEFSKELCGGTHVANTGQVGLFRITHEESVSAGTRRIVALTGRRAGKFARINSAAETAASLRVPPSKCPTACGAGQGSRELKKQLAAGPKAGGVPAKSLSTMPRRSAR